MSLSIKKYNYGWAPFIDFNTITPNSRALALINVIHLWRHEADCDYDVIIDLHNGECIVLIGGDIYTRNVHRG